jgi:hypothetical protein
MRRYWGLICVSALTQLILFSSQILLLPVQLLIWGEVRTAGWYSSLAVAMLASIADLGFRVKGHDELILIRDQPDNTDARDRFSRTWDLVRLLIVVITLAISLADFLVQITLSQSPELWRISLIAAFGVETLVVVRVMYFDTFRNYVTGELSYLTIIASRIVVALPAILFLGWTEAGLAHIYLFSGVAGLLLQEHLCSRQCPFRLREKVRHWLTLADLSEAWRTCADPLTNWARLSLPILVLEQIAPHRAVTAYVALRAVFSALRSVLQQVARVGSTEYLFVRSNVSLVRANHVLTLFLVGSAFLASAAGVACLLDRLRLIQYWVPNLDPAIYLPLASAFAVSSAFYPYQILLSALMRQGDIAKIAQVEYGYLILITITSLVVVAMGSLPIYPVALALSEIGLATGFYLAFATPAHSASRIGLRSSALSSIVVLGAVAYIQMGDGLPATWPQLTPLQADLLVAVVFVCLLGLVAWHSSRQALWSLWRSAPIPPVASRPEVRQPGDQP